MWFGEPAAGRAPSRTRVVGADHTLLCSREDDALARDKAGHPPPNQRAPYTLPLLPIAPVERKTTIRGYAEQSVHHPSRK